MRTGATPPPNRFTTEVPLYLQIAEGLLSRIEAGELSPGDRLAPERDLSKELGVNRMTLRRALGMLELRGLIVRRQGDGTYIAQPKIERQASSLVPFTSGMQRQGYSPDSKIIMFERRLAQASIARDLSITVGATVYFIHRLRLVNQEPLLLERFVLPAQLMPDFERFDLAVRSLYEVMETEYGILVNRARQSLEPVIATEYEAELLGIMPGAPLMLERRLTFDQTDCPVEYGRDLYRGDRFRFVTEVAPLER